LFADGDRKRRTIRLGRVPVKTAESFRLRVESLLAAQTAGVPVAQDDARWLAELTATMHDRLVRVGLAEPRADAVRVTLGELLEDYFGTLEVKPGTRTTYEQTRRTLEEYFGADHPLDSIDARDADHWRAGMVDAGLAPATIAKRVKTARMIFARGVRWGMLASNPFADMKAGSMSNRARLVFVPAVDVERVLAVCPDPQWRVLIALSRYGALRIPSEALALRWEHIDWERGRMTVPSPKTASQGRESRIVPLFPELRQHLLAAFEAAPDGAEYVVARSRDAGINLRTGLQRLIARAGVQSWPRLWHNMRASRATELASEFPQHVAAAWCGHTEAIAEGHYWQVRDEDFDRATAEPSRGGAESGALVAQNAAQHRSAPGRAESKERAEVSIGAGVTRARADSREPPHKALMTPGGFEPPFSG